MTESTGKIMETTWMCTNGSEATKAHSFPPSAY